MTLTVLGLDVSLRSTGWARLTYESGDLIDCGLITTHPGNLATRVHQLHEAIWQLVADSDDVAIEDGISHRSGKVTRQLAAAWGGAVCAVRRAGRDPLEVNVSTVKKLATGNGNAGKVDVQIAAWHRWDFHKLPAADIADACWVAEVCRRDLHRRFPEEAA